MFCLMPQFTGFRCFPPGQRGLSEGNQAKFAALEGGKDIRARFGEPGFLKKQGKAKSQCYAAACGVNALF